MRPLVVVALLGIAALASAQSDVGYATGENPYGADYTLKVEVEGVRFDNVVVNLLSSPTDAQVSCEVLLDGTSVSDRKANLNVVLLLENAKGEGIERIMLDPFKAKSQKPFSEKQKKAVQGKSINDASRVYVLIKIG